MAQVLHFCRLSGQTMEEKSSVPFPQLKGSALISVPAALNTAARGSAGVLIGPLVAMVAGDGGSW